MSSSIAGASVLLKFPGRIFTTKRPNAFESLRKMLEGFQTAVDGGKKTAYIAINSLPKK